MNIKKTLRYAPLLSALLFLATIPFNIRTIFNFDQIQQIDGFRENVSFSLFFFDISFLLLFLSLCYEIFFSKKPISKEKNYLKLFKNPLSLFIVWLVFSVFFATDLLVAAYVTSRILMAILTFLVLRKVFEYKRKSFIYASFALLVSGVIQSVIGILQFVFQKSIGLKLLGESTIANTIPGVAKFEVAGSKIIRAYGTFPHPNVFAAFLLLAFAAGIWLVIYANISKKSKVLNIFLPSSLAIIITGIVFSYSRSVILVLFIFILILIIVHKEKFFLVFRQIYEHFYIPRVLQGTFSILLLFSLLFVSYNTLSPRICFNHCANDNSINLRVEYLKTAHSEIVLHPLQGVGMGNFVTFQKEKASKKITSWAQQPVHNLYLLIASEVGLIGLALFLYLLVHLGQIFKKGFFGRLHNPFILCFFAFLVLGFADHYFWTLPQGILIFWVCLAFFHSSAKITRINKPKKSAKGN